MRIKRIVLFSVVLSVLFSFPALAASQKVQVDCGGNKISISLPGNFKYITKDDIEKPGDYFSSFPISKNDAIKRINDYGIVIDAFSTDRSREIKISVYQNNLSQKIINFTPLDEENQLMIAQTFAETATGQGHTMLDTPCIVKCNKYSFLKYSARVGTLTGGHIYTKMFTVIGGTAYEVVCYDALTMPDENTVEQNDKVFESFKLKIKGDSGEIANNMLMTVISVVIVILCIGFIVFSVYIIVSYEVQRHNTGESVRLKKRD